MKFNTSQFPLVSQTTSFHFVDARLSEQEIKSRRRRTTLKNLAIAAVIMVAFSFIVAHLGMTGVSLV